MIQIIDITQANEWDDIVRSFAEYDIYYLSGYVYGFRIHGDGEPVLLYYKDGEFAAMCVYIKREICSCSDLHNAQFAQGYFDLITPYGYGGFIFSSLPTCDQLNRFKSEYIKYLQQHHIVSEFVRYHPMLKNANNMRNISNVIDLGKTISMDLASDDIIWANISSKNRNVIRKAIKNNVEIHHSTDAELFSTFIEIYNSTMNRDNAEQYYYFEKEFYDSISKDLNGNYEIFYAQLDDKIIAMSIMLFANGNMHYHLSGSLSEYRNLAPTNLLLYEAAKWGSGQGFKYLHLGGGVGSGEDNLYKFKREFNRNSDNRFSIGKTIINQEMYDKLVDYRKSINNEFNKESAFFPLYRA